MYKCSAHVEMTVIVSSTIVLSYTAIRPVSTRCHFLIPPPVTGVGGLCTSHNAPNGSFGWAWAIGGRGWPKAPPGAAAAYIAGCWGIMPAAIAGLACGDMPCRKRTHCQNVIFTSDTYIYMYVTPKYFAIAFSTFKWSPTWKYGVVIMNFT